MSNSKKSCDSDLSRKINYLSGLMEQNGKVIETETLGLTQYPKNFSSIKNKYKLTRLNPSSKIEPLFSISNNIFENENISFDKLKKTNQNPDKLLYSKKLSIVEPKDSQFDGIICSKAELFSDTINFDIKLSPQNGCINDDKKPMTDINPPPSIGNSDKNVQIQKSIHLNIKRLSENLGLKDDLRLNKNCVHINPAKVQLKSDLKSRLEFDDNYLSKNIIHVNPNFSKLYSESKFSDVSDSVMIIDDNKTESDDIVKAKTFKKSHFGVSVTGVKEKALKIHFNKKFIKNSSNTYISRADVKGKFSTKEAAKSEIYVPSSPLNTKNILNLLESSSHTLKTWPIHKESNNKIYEPSHNVLNCSTARKSHLRKNVNLVCKSEQIHSNFYSKFDRIIPSRRDFNSSSLAVVNKCLIDGQPSTDRNLLEPQIKFKYSNLIINNQRIPNQSFCLTSDTNENSKLAYKDEHHRVTSTLNSDSKLLLISNTKLVRTKICPLPNCSYSSDQLTKPELKEYTKKTKNKVWVAGCKNKETPLKNEKFNLSKETSRCLCVPKYSAGNCVQRISPTRSSVRRKIIEKENFTSHHLSESHVSCKKRISSQVSNGNLVSLSKTKLVRSSFKTNSCKFNRLSKNIQEIDNFTLNYRNAARITPALRSARSVKTKYKLIRNSYLSRTKTNHSTGVMNCIKPTQSSGSRYKACHGILRGSQKLARRKSVTIGGIKYHITKTKLTRKFQERKCLKVNKIFKNKGQSYRVTDGGKSLKRIRSYDHVIHNRQLRRLSRSTFQNNAYNTAHNRVLLAKQRSIALLTRKLRKSNEPCLIYNRLGRCAGQERGVCNRLHDPKRIVVCKRFLRGACDEKNCLLLHNVDPSKMPTCRHFLAGICMRDDCPYLHVKVNSSAPICIPFLQGHCPYAEKCKKRHSAVCPDYEEKGICVKGKSCPYPHPKLKKYDTSEKPDVEDQKSNNAIISVNNENRNCNFILDEETARMSHGADTKPSAGRRYYCCTQGYGDGDKLLCDNDRLIQESDNWLFNRPKVGSLPGFIPLNCEL